METQQVNEKTTIITESYIESEITKKISRQENGSIIMNRANWQKRKYIKIISPKSTFCANWDAEISLDFKTINRLPALAILNE